MLCPCIAMAHGSGGGIAIVLWAIAIPAALVWAVAMIAKLVLRAYRWRTSGKPSRPEQPVPPTAKTPWEEADEKARELWKKGRR
jgi:hypothetical protein